MAPVLRSFTEEEYQGEEVFRHDRNDIRGMQTFRCFPRFSRSRTLENKSRSKGNERSAKYFDRISIMAVVPGRTTYRRVSHRS